MFASSQKTQLLRAFNTYFFEFLQTAIDFFPDNTDVKTAKTTAALIKQTNPTCIVKAWQNQLAVPYAEEIAEGNFDYFIEKDYKSDIDLFECGGDSTNGVLKIIDDLRLALRGADYEQKRILFNYIQNLSNLSAHYTKEYCAS